VSEPRRGPSRARRRGGSSDARVVWPPSDRQTARDAISQLMHERGLGRPFPRNVQREARRAAGSADESSRSPGRKDLRDLPTFTIDPLSARDFDDAISAEALGADEVRVWVHIADVSAFVTEGCALDLEARSRATSVYVPDAVEPMLPAALSNEACSLVPGAERLAVTVELDLAGAEVRRASFYRSLIRSDERLDYERVDRIFAGREDAADPWRAPLAAARRAAAALARARERRGALVIDAAEAEFLFDEHGNVSTAVARIQTESHRLIEHLMIAANEAVAQLLEQRRVPCLYRVHERPDPASVARLAEQLTALEVPTPPIPDRMSPSQAGDLIGEISRRVEEHARRTGRGRLALGTLVLRSLKQAYYSPRNGGHAGLRSQAYCHFTSPIRRYPDLVCHRALLSAVGEEERGPRAGELAELGRWASEREREAMEIERDADDIARCFALEGALYEGGWEQVLAGEIVGLIAAGAFVAFGPTLAAPAQGAEESALSEELAAVQVYEGMIAVRRLRAAHAESDPRRRAQAGAGGRRAADWWELDELGTMLRAQGSGAALRLGDRITVRVLRVDAPRGRVDLEPAEPESSA
jgi:ribonuclease R